MSSPEFVMGHAAVYPSQLTKQAGVRVAAEMSAEVTLAAAGYVKKKCEACDGCGVKSEEVLVGSDKVLRRFCCPTCDGGRFLWVRPKK